jgi:hypothetical protein
MALIRGFLTIGAIKSLVAEVSNEYDPFHPDGWAGFSPISEFATRMFYVVVGFVLGIITLTVEANCQFHGLSSKT